jgi:hypothetical protein
VHLVLKSLQPRLVGVLAGKRASVQLTEAFGDQGVGMGAAVPLGHRLDQIFYEVAKREALAAEVPRDGALVAVTLARKIADRDVQGAERFAQGLGKGHAFWREFDIQGA